MGMFNAPPLRVAAPEVPVVVRVSACWAPILFQLIVIGEAPLKVDPDAAPDPLLLTVNGFVVVPPPPPPVTAAHVPLLQV